MPGSVKQRYALHLLDCIGCGYAAIRKDAFTNVAQLMRPWTGEQGASILGRDGRFAAEDAALANGALFHALDFDDTHGPSVCHPTAVVLAAGLAAAEEFERSGSDVFVASIVGTEAIARIGMARHNAFHLKGFHPSSVVGVFGAALSAGILMRLNEEELTNALGIAGSLASGVFAYLDGESNPKPIHVGQAARNGIAAARLARAGVTGPATIFESRFGLYGAFLGASETALPELLESLGEVWESAHISIKPYPACHSMHACLDSVFTLQMEHGFSIEDIAKIHAYLATERDVNLVMEPGEVKKRPASPTVGKFSLPYSLASLIKDRKLGIDSYDRGQLGRPDVLGLAEKVTYSLRTFATAGKALPGGVEVELRSGQRHYFQVDNERGGPINAMGEADIIEKFRANLGMGSNRKSRLPIEERIFGLQGSTAGIPRELFRAI